MKKTLTGLSLGKETVFTNLSVTPLLGGADGEQDYLMFDESLVAGKARIKEVSKEGSVPDLLFENQGISLQLDGANGSA